MKVDTVIFLIFACLAIISNLFCGRLLLETLSSEKGFLASFAFTNLFTLWLLPPLIGLVLLALKLVKRKKN